MDLIGERSQEVTRASCAARPISMCGNRRCASGVIRFAPYRFVRSIKKECLNRVILLGECHLRRTMAEFVAHYHAERNHQGIGNELIQPLRRTNAPGSVRRRQRVGDMLNYYYRAA